MKTLFLALLVFTSIGLQGKEYFFNHSTFYTRWEAKNELPVLQRNSAISDIKVTQVDNDNQKGFFIEWKEKVILSD